jgi:3-hydroxyacyl-CoA dehydrogenase
MLGAALAEAERMIADGVRPDDIDRVLYDFGFPAGVFSFAGTPGAPHSEIGDSEVLDRFLGAMTNEGVRLLDEGIALRASDIDVLWVLGYGFPAYRGGPMFHAGKGFGEA